MVGLPLETLGIRLEEIMGLAKHNSTWVTLGNVYCSCNGKEHQVAENVSAQDQRQVLGSGTSYNLGLGLRVIITCVGLSLLLNAVVASQT